MPDIGPTGEMPLTLPQLDFWEEFTFHPDQPVSTVAHYIELEGDIDELALTRAITRTIREAEILSARFRVSPDGGAPVQVCDPEFLPALIQVDLREEAEPLEVARKRMETDLAAKLDLRHDKLSAHAVYRVGERKYLWYIRAHHIIVDGYGLALIEQRCAELYNHYRGQGDAGLPFHPLASFLSEEARYQESRQWNDDKAFWSDYFARASDIEVLERGDEDYGGPGYHAQVSLTSEFTRNLQATAATVEIGWPDLLTLLCGLYLLPERPGLQMPTENALTLWLPFMSRWGSVGAHLPALLVNILPFRMEVNRTDNLVDFLKGSATELKRQRRYSRYRIEQISQDQGLTEGSRYFFSPLINVLPFNAPAFTGCRSRRHILGSGPADGFNLTFRGEDDASNLTLCLDADPSLMSTQAFSEHEKKLPSFLSDALQPEWLTRPVGDVLGTTCSSALFDAAVQRFPM